MTVKAQMAAVLRETFPSDVALELWTLASRISGFKELLSSLLRVIIVIDANCVHRELEFRLLKRKNPEARSSLTEAIESGVWIAIAPPFLDQEIEKYVEDIARRCGKSEEAVREEWLRIRSLFRYCQPSSKAKGREINVDPKDVPYARLQEEFGADAVYTCDPDFPEMGIPVVTVRFDTLVRDYSRAKAMEVGITFATGTTVSVSLGLLTAAIRKAAGGWKRLPNQVQFAIVAGIGLSIAHPRSRRLLITKFRALLDQLKTFGPPVLEIAAEWFVAYGSAQNAVEELERKVRGNLRKSGRVSAAILAKRVFIMDTGPLTLLELESKMFEAGYASRAKNFRAYLKRVLRSDARFLEVERGRWDLAPAFAR